MWLDVEEYGGSGYRLPSILIIYIKPLQIFSEQLPGHTEDNVDIGMLRLKCINMNNRLVILLVASILKFSIW